MPSISKVGIFLIFTFTVVAGINPLHLYQQKLTRKRFDYSHGFSSNLQFPNSARKRSFYGYKDEESPPRKRHEAIITAKEVTECMTVLMEEGSYYFESKGNSEPCGVYITSEERHLIEVEISYLDVTCDSEGLVVFFDGWELNGNVLPSEYDHPIPLRERFQDVCTNGRPINRKIRFVSSQNAALLQYRIPVPGQGFKFTIRLIENPEPCNILMVEKSGGIFTLTNFGEHKNCSLTTLLFPANFELMDMKVGVSDMSKRNTDAGIIAPCTKPNDFVELGGSSELDSSHLTARETICGGQNKPGEKGLTVLCGSSTVRLVSSGSFQNSVTILIRAAEAEDLDFDKNYVLACPGYL